MRKLKIGLIALIILAVAAVAGFGVYQYIELKNTKLTDLLKDPNAHSWMIKRKIASDQDNINSLQDGVSPLMLATLLQKDPEVFQAFLKAGADVNLKGEHDITALMLAASVQTPEVIDILLKAGAEVNAVSDEGYTPLIFAADNNPNPAVISQLVAAGGNINYINKDGKSVLLSAALNNRNSDVLKQVVDSGAMVDDVLFMGLIANRANVGAIKVLIDQGINVNYQDQEGFTPLLIAIIEAFSVETVQALIDAGADVNAAYKDGITPLMIAAQRQDDSLAIRLIKNAGKTVDSPEFDEIRDDIIKEQKALEAVNLGIVQLLINAGADLNAKSAEGRTALSYAEENQKGTRVVDALIKAGATE